VKATNNYKIFQIISKFVTVTSHYSIFYAFCTVFCVVFGVKNTWLSSAKKCKRLVKPQVEAPKAAWVVVA